MYFLESSKRLDKIIAKVAKRDPIQYAALQKKIRQILEDPHRFKPLHAPLQHLRRVHIFGSFVLTYSIAENRKAVVLEDYAHHDQAY